MEGDQLNQEITEHYLDPYHEVQIPNAPDGDALTGLVSACVNCGVSHVDLEGINSTTTSSGQPTTTTSQPSPPEPIIEYLLACLNNPINYNKTTHGQAQV